MTDEVEIGADSLPWPSTFDAVAWAKEFVKRHPGSDVDDMLGWFANAIMAGHDRRARMEDQREGREASTDEREEFGWLIEKHRGPTVEWWAGGDSWSHDASLAIRFSRRRDAEIVLTSTLVLLRVVHPNGPWVGAVEHAWISSPPALERCPAQHPEGHGQCGLPKGAHTKHTLLIPSGSPWLRGVTAEWQQ